MLQNTFYKIFFTIWFSNASYSLKYYIARNKNNIQKFSVYPVTKNLFSSYFIAIYTRSLTIESRDEITRAVNNEMY